MNNPTIQHPALRHRERPGLLPPWVGWQGTLFSADGGEGEGGRGESSIIAIWNRQWALAMAKRGHTETWAHPHVRVGVTACVRKSREWRHHQPWRSRGVGRIFDGSPFLPSPDAAHRFRRWAFRYATSLVKVPSSELGRARGFGRVDGRIMRNRIPSRSRAPCLALPVSCSNPQPHPFIEMQRRLHTLAQKQIHID
jgi:hypothetical protein